MHGPVGHPEPMEIGRPRACSDLRPARAGRSRGPGRRERPDLRTALTARVGRPAGTAESWIFEAAAHAAKAAAGNDEDHTACHLCRRGRRRSQVTSTTSPPATPTGRKTRRHGRNRDLRGRGPSRHRGTRERRRSHRRPPRGRGRPRPYGESAASDQSAPDTAGRGRRGFWARNSRGGRRSRITQRRKCPRGLGANRSWILRLDVCLSGCACCAGSAAPLGAHGGWCSSAGSSAADRSRPRQCWRARSWYWLPWGLWLGVFLRWLARVASLTDSRRAPRRATS